MDQSPGLGWDRNALELAHRRYLNSQFPDVRSWLRAVADLAANRYVGSERSKYADLYASAMCGREFLPSSTVLGSVTVEKPQTAACAVLSIGNDLDEDLSAFLSLSTRIAQDGTGIGVDLSGLAPRLSHFTRTGRSHPGPCSILKSVVPAIAIPAEYAGVRRAAFMACMEYSHPDIFEFIYLKTTNAIPEVNCSVSLSRGFRQALERDGLIPVKYLVEREEFILHVDDLRDWELRGRSRNVAPPDLYIGDDSTKVISRAAGRPVGFVIDGRIFVTADSIFNSIAEACWRCGDPGILDITEINVDNPTHPRNMVHGGAGIGELTCTAPCGEQPLLVNELCQLGSVNLAAVARKGFLDKSALASLAAVGARFLDDVIDVTHFPSSQSEEICRANRKIGLGVMGLADLFAYLGIEYGSERSIECATEVVRTIHQSAIETSSLLARERGAYPNSRLLKNSTSAEMAKRNSSLMCIAPTGHISALAGCSPSIEPFFGMQDRRWSTVHPLTCRPLSTRLAADGTTLESWIERTAENKDWRFDGTLRSLPDETYTGNDPSILKSLRSIFVCSTEISPAAQIDMVSALQNEIDNAISKTVNVKHETTVAEIREFFDRALKKGIKGITIFRERSHAGNP